MNGAERAASRDTSPLARVTGDGQPATVPTAGSRRPVPRGELAERDAFRPPPESITGSAEREVALEGDAARAWLGRRGWTVTGHSRPFLLRADEIASEGFVLRRHWTSPVEMTRSADRSSPDMVDAVFLLDGDLAVVEPQELSLGTDGVLISPRSTPLSVRAGKPTAIVQVETAWSTLSLQAPARATLREVDPELRQVFVVTATAILNASLGPGHSGFAQLRASVEAMVAAVLQRNAIVPDYPGTSASMRDLFRLVTTVIDARAADPLLTIDVIAAETNMSKQYIQRAFRPTGLSPLRYLRIVRAMRARTLIRARGARTSRELAEIARMTGFASVENMRDVIARELPVDAAIPSFSDLESEKRGGEKPK